MAGCGLMDDCTEMAFVYISQGSILLRFSCWAWICFLFFLLRAWSWTSLSVLVRVISLCRHWTMFVDMDRALGIALRLSVMSGVACFFPLIQ